MLVLLVLIVSIQYIHAFECGIANDVTTGQRIVGGEAIGYVKYPWFAVLHIPGRVFYSICAGSLITSQHVLSAAHCFSQPKDDPDKPKNTFYEVTLGLYNRCDLTPTHQTFKTRKVVVHEKYKTAEDGYDISLITLDRRADFMPVCLPAKGSLIVHVPTAYIQGFGTLEFGKVNQPCEMNEATVEIFTTEECKKSNLSKIEMKKIWDSEMGFCAGYVAGGKDTCQGDSGGSLLVKWKGRYVQEGIVSFGYGCGSPGFPGIYTHVASYIDWIKKKTGGLSANNKPIGTGNAGLLSTMFEMINNYG